MISGQQGEKLLLFVFNFLKRGLQNKLLFL